MEISINLIPDYKKEEIKKSNRLRLVWRLGWLLFISLSLFFVSLWSLEKILDFNLQAMLAEQESANDRAQYAEIRRFDEQFRAINKDISNVEKVKNDQIYWSNLFIFLSNGVPSGIEITNLISKDYQISLAGKADNRDSLIAFEENLKKNNCFFDVNLPLSNLVSPENIAMQMDFKIKEECAKRK